MLTSCEHDGSVISWFLTVDCKDQYVQLFTISYIHLVNDLAGEEEKESYRLLGDLDWLILMSSCSHLLQKKIFAVMNLDTDYLHVYFKPQLTDTLYKTIATQKHWGTSGWFIHSFQRLSRSINVWISWNEILMMMNWWWTLFLLQPLIFPIFILL